jgi:hypothetical protein
MVYNNINQYRLISYEGGKAVKKVVSFIDSDQELVDKIEEYQKAHGLSSFVAVVRKLCNDALEIEKIRH